MDTKTKISELMAERGWSVYELSKRTGLAQTTLANMWKRNTEPAIPTLKAICDSFGITLSQFFSDGESADLTIKQKELLNSWSCLSSEQQELLIKLIKTMRNPSER